MRLYLDLCSSAYVALDNGQGQVLAQRISRPPVRNEEALGVVESLLRDLGAAYSDITAIAVASGPGSFTGIRVGLAMAQGLAFAKQLPLHAFSTLGAVQAALATPGVPSFVSLAAQGGRWYARHSQEGRDRLFTAEDMQVALAARPHWLVTGELPKDMPEAWPKPLRMEDVLGVSALPSETWSRLMAYAFSETAAPRGMIKPRYVQVSAAEAKRLNSESEPEIRHLQTKDAEALATLEQECNPQPWSLATVSNHIAALSPSTSSQSPEFQVIASFYWGAGLFLGDTLVGYWLGQSVGEEAEILLVGVGLSWRRKGLARSLLTEALATFVKSGIRKVHLEVRAGNVPALGLYSELGFSRQGERKGYYTDNGENAVLMDLVLP